jgi:hypothetical protein
MHWQQCRKSQLFLPRLSLYGVFAYKTQRWIIAVAPRCYYDYSSWFVLHKRLTSAHKRAPARPTLLFAICRARGESNELHVIINKTGAASAAHVWLSGVLHSLSLLQIMSNERQPEREREQVQRWINYLSGSNQPPIGEGAVRLIYGSLPKPMRPYTASLWHTDWIFCAADDKLSAAMDISCRD